MNVLTGLDIPDDVDVEFIRDEDYVYVMNDETGEILEVHTIH